MQWQAYLEVFSFSIRFIYYVLFERIEMDDSRLEVDTAKCEACGMCVASCPNSNFEMMDSGGKIVSIHKEIKCNQCGSCILVCESSAIIVRNNCSIITFDEKLCTACERCVLACPEGLYEIIHKEGAYYSKRKQGNCRKDRRCAFICKTKAIR